MAFLELKEVKKEFLVREGFFSTEAKRLRAVDGVNLRLDQGETLGLVGESGCGKTTTGRIICRLLEKTSGQVLFNGEEIFSLSDERMTSLRKDIQMIFQDPLASLDPRMRVGDSISEGLVIHRMGTAEARKKRTRDLLRMMGLDSQDYDRFPHEFSGGQRQRVGIARALATQPRLLVADEPISALDVSIQAQILNLLGDLQKELGFSMIFIAHDLRVVAHLSQRISVMYTGKVIELAESEDLVTEPLHPYSQALLSAIPWPEPEQRRKREVLEGEPPSPLAIPAGCPFHPRCRFRMAKCVEQVPPFAEARPGRWTACWLY